MMHFGVKARLLITLIGVSFFGIFIRRYRIIHV